ncbi:MAG: ATP synthase F1 subunit delta [Myxococcota bacterium]
MANHRSAARRYAAAFLSLASDLGQVEALGKDLDTVLEAARVDDGVLLNVLANPVFTADERVSVITTLMPGLGVQPMTSNLIRLMVEKGRFAALPDLVEIYHAEADALAGRVRVQLTTADSLSDDLAAEIRTALERSTGKQIVLDTQIDPDLIGGLVARVGGKVYDASVRARLDDLKYRLIHGTTAAQA